MSFSVTGASGRGSRRWGRDPTEVSTFLQKGRPIIQAAGPALVSSWCHERCALDAASAMFIANRLIVQRNGSRCNGKGATNEFASARI